jgi:hypothetical protein
VRFKALVPIASLLFAGCETATATLGVATTGMPPRDRPFGGFGGFRVEAALERDGATIGTWEPARQASVIVDPGDYSLVISLVEVSDLITCTGGGANPTCLQQTGDQTFFCQTPVTLAAGETVGLEIDLATDQGPCRTTRR